MIVVYGHKFDILSDRMKYFVEKYSYNTVKMFTECNFNTNNWIYLYITQIAETK